MTSGIKWSGSWPGTGGRDGTPNEVVGESACLRKKTAGFSYPEMSGHVMWEVRVFFLIILRQPCTAVNNLLFDGLKFNAPLTLPSQ